jgi:hypothetical protein
MVLGDIAGCVTQSLEDQFMPMYFPNTSAVGLDQRCLVSAIHQAVEGSS